MVFGDFGSKFPIASFACTPISPFFEFVEAALGQLDQYAVQGVESDVKAIVAEMAKLDP